VQRRVVITEEFGVYRLQTTGGIDVSGPSTENVLVKAGIEFVEYLPAVAQAAETLLGEKREGGGQIHTGQVSA
jgi:hypothetical protein